MYLKKSFIFVIVLYILFIYKNILLIIKHIYKLFKAILYTKKNYPLYNFFFFLTRLLMITKTSKHYCRLQTIEINWIYRIQKLTRKFAINKIDNT